jgi:methylglutaconyl-CoA hydratase
VHRRIAQAPQAKDGTVTLQTISADISPRRIATITLNRPDRGNAFDQTMLNELGDQLKSFAADDAVRIVVLRGAGKHFCTGADLASRGPGAQAPEPAKYSLRNVLALLDSMPKPTVAVVEGGAIGGGAGFVTCCDLAIATRAAFLSVPEVRVGMAPFGIMPFMIRAIGHRAFRRYGLSGERIQAADALRLGLVHDVCEPPALETTLTQITDALLLGAPHASAALKAAAARYASPNLDAIIAHVQPPHDPKSPEAQEGIAAFREKRKPSWYPQS